MNKVTLLNILVVAEKEGFNIEESASFSENIEKAKAFLVANALENDTFEDLKADYTNGNLSVEADGVEIIQSGEIMDSNMYARYIDGERIDLEFIVGNSGTVYQLFLLNE